MVISTVRRDMTALCGGLGGEGKGGRRKSPLAWSVAGTATGKAHKFSPPLAGGGKGVAPGTGQFTAETILHPVACGSERCGWGANGPTGPTGELSRARTVIAPRVSAVMIEASQYAPTPPALAG